MFHCPSWVIFYFSYPSMLPPPFTLSVTLSNDGSTRAITSKIWERKQRDSITQSRPVNNSSSLLDLYIALGALRELGCHGVYVNLIQPAAFQCTIQSARRMTINSSLTPHQPGNTYTHSSVLLSFIHTCFFFVNIQIYQYEWGCFSCFFPLCMTRLHVTGLHVWVCLHQAGWDSMSY